MISNLTSDFIGSLLGVWAVEINVWSIIFRIFLSFLCASIIGCERSSKRHSAGLRTFILVSCSCTVSMLIDVIISKNLTNYFYFISASSVISVSIMSVNSIVFSSKSLIRGLTTSVGLWACAILGLSFGAGLYVLGFVAFFMILLGLSVFPSIEGYLKDRSNHFEIHIELKNPKFLQNFVATLRELGIKIDDIEFNNAYLNSGLSVYYVAVTISSGSLKKYKTHKEIIQALSTLDYVYHIEELG